MSRRRLVASLAFLLESMSHAAQREGPMRLLAVIYLAVVWGVCAFTLLLATANPR